jgi:aryl-alcohol dehydrogenase-like predicted oxidoreductase
MSTSSSRRDFLAAGLALPAASLNTTPVRPLAGSSSSAAIPLRYRTIGKTGLKVTKMGFGCMITSDPSVIEKAADLGINLFDTARVYGGGNNERMVGAALKSRRKNLVLASKSRSATRQAALEDLETSLKELQTDYLDVWYLHNKTKASDVSDELMEAQRIAKKQGKIRFAGISTHIGHEEVFPAAIKARHFDVILTSYHFAMDRSIEKLIQAAKDAGIGIVAMKVMAGGFRKSPYYPSDDNTRSRLSKEGAMLAALKWTLKNPNVDTAIPSIIDMDQLDEDLKAMAAPFTPADEKLLAAHLDYIRPRYCRMCDRCSGTCPQGLPVADMLRFLMYAEGYGQFALGREHFKELPAAVQQVRCADCSRCAVQCPNGVQVAQRLILAQELFA